MDMTPWLLGSGKFVMPCLRMHAEYFGPSFTSTCMAIWNWPPAPTRGTFPADTGPLSVVVVVLAGGGGARSATPGDSPPPPQPAARTEMTTTGSALTKRRGMPKG